MSDEKRQAERVPIGLRVRLRFADMESFVAGYAANISRNGVYLEGVAPRPTDTLVRFELLLADGTVALRGEGKVIWSRTEGAETGIALRFTKLESRSKALIDDLVARSRVAVGSIPPPPPAASRAVRIAATDAAKPRTPLVADPAPPLRVQITPARPSRLSVTELDEQLVALERETLERVSRTPRTPPGARASMVDIDRELGELASLVPPAPSASREPLAPPRVAAPSIVSRPVPVVRSVAPPSAPGDEDDLPPIFGLLGDDGEVHSAIDRAAPSRVPAVPGSRAPVAAQPAPAAAEPEPLPERMREPTPVPSEPPEEIDPEDDDEEDTALNAIPQAPPLPRADVAASAALDMDLPNLELAVPEEPDAQEPHPVAASEAPKRRSLLGKLLGR